MARNVIALLGTPKNSARDHLDWKECIRGFAAAHSGKALPFRPCPAFQFILRLRLRIGRRSLQVKKGTSTVSRRLTAMCCGIAAFRPGPLAITFRVLDSLPGSDPAG